MFKNAQEKLLNQTLAFAAVAAVVAAAFQAAENPSDPCPFQVAFPFLVDPSPLDLACPDLAYPSGPDLAAAFHPFPFP